MSLDFSLLVTKPTAVFSANITHNLNEMAEEAGIYKCLWRPRENGFLKASSLVAPLCDAVAMMKKDPKRFKAFDSPNGWGRYEHFLPFVEEILAACQEFPDADTEADV